MQLIDTTPEYQYITEFNIASGRQMTESDMNQSRQNAMIGKTVADELFPSRSVWESRFWLVVTGLRSLQFGGEGITFR